MIKITWLALGRHVTIRKEEEAGIKGFRKTLLWSGMSQMHMDGTLPWKQENIKEHFTGKTIIWGWLCFQR